MIAAVIRLTAKKRFSNRVSKEMQERGYRHSVNPRAKWQSNFCETVYASLKDIPFPVILSMYTAAVSFLPDVALDFLQSDAKIFWAQLGLESEVRADFCGQPVGTTLSWTAALNVRAYPLDSGRIRWASYHSWHLALASLA